jgi:hypothetical protein
MRVPNRSFDPLPLKNLRAKGNVFKHREHVADIIATSSFTVQSFPINPGLQSSFPWLSQVAQAYEQYAFIRLVYEYKSLSANSTNTAPGYVIMATNYNSLDGLFPDKATMENYQFANSGKPGTSFIHPVQCSRDETPISNLYVRTTNIANGTDVRLYDLGLFQIATGGSSSALGLIGELWCTLEVAFIKAKLSSAIGYELLTDHYTLATSSIGDHNTFGYPINKYPNSGSTLGSNIADAYAISLPSSVVDGNWLYIYQCTGSSAAVAAATISFTNAVPLMYWNNETSASVDNGGTTATTFMQCVTFRVSITIPGAPTQIVLNDTNQRLPAAVTGADVWLMQIGDSVSS